MSDEFIWSQMTVEQLKWRRADLQHDVDRGVKNADVLKGWIAEIDAELDAREQSA